MESRPLGRTGLTVSRIGLGLAALGRPGYINLGHAGDLGSGRAPERMQAHAIEVLDAAFAHGVRYFDAARSYGRAEAFLAAWLSGRGLEPGSVTVGSKWGYVYTAGWRVEAEKHEVKDHSVENLRRQAHESRETLGRFLNLYQIHSATLESGVLENAEVLSELARLREGGLAVGLSVSGPSQAAVIREALEVEVDGAPLFDAVQATWNLLEPSAGPALTEAHARGLGVIVKEALANGRLTARNDSPEFVDRRARLERAASEAGVALDAFALAAVLAQPWADVVLSGAATSDQLASNLGSLSAVDLAARFEEAQGFAESPEQYWSTRSELPWN